MEQKEKWIDKTMSSLQGMQPAAANPFMHTRILAKLQEAVTDKVPVRWALASAFGFLFLLWVNVKVFTAGGNQQHNNNGVEQVMQEYSLGNNNIYSYDSK